MNKETVDLIQKKLKEACGRVSMALGNPNGNVESERRKTQLKRKRA
jgi:hypothetical protein